MRHRTWRWTLMAVSAVTVVVLCIPLIAMQVTDEVNWSVGDFGLGAVLLWSAGMGIATGLRRAPTLAWKVFVGVLVLMVLALIWAQLAVGVFDG